METPPDATLGLDVLAPDSPPPGRCTRDLDCADRIACTIDHCEDGECVHDACADCCPADLVCDPGLGCGPAPEPCTTDAECRDDVPCTLDRCRDRMFCEHLPEPALCERGEICLGGVGCIPEPPSSCETAEDCATGSVCAAVWRCEPEFGCAFVSPLDCDDADDCTTDSCSDAAGGCTHEPIDEDDDGAVLESCGGEDCDDTDPDVISCDSSPGETAETGGGSGDDTGDTGDTKTPDECGCASTGSAGAGAFGLALVVLALRRRQ